MENEKTTLDRYFEEIRPEKRYKILEEELKGEPEYETLVEIWNLRFGKDPKGKVDGFLRQFVELSILPPKTMFPAKRRAEILNMLKKAGVGTSLSEDRKSEHLLYRELRNTFRRYIDSCRDPGYGKKFFGLFTSSEQEKEPLICRDIFKMSLGAAENYGLEKEMETILEAANDEYVAFNTDAGSLRQAFRDFYPGWDK